MDSSSPGVLAVLLVLGACAGLATPAGAVGGDVGRVAQAAEANPELRQTVELRLTPGQPGEIAVRLSYQVPPEVTQLRTELPAAATVVETTGFRHEGGTEYAWTETTRTPSVVFRMPANVTREATGPIAGRGDYLFVDAGEWAVVRQPPISTSWGWTGVRRVSLSRETTIAGPGATGDAIAFLGEHRELRHAAHDQTFRLVVPERARLAAPPERVFDAMSEASDALRVGDRDETVFLVAAPTDGVAWGVRGLQLGDADAWVRDIEPLDTPDNVWLHEYVHTRQSYETTRGTRWVIEGTATYYAALLALQQGRIGYDDFRGWLERGADERRAGAVLADPDTWTGGAEYYKGALVAGDLDRRVRLGSNRTRAFQTVFSEMNARGEPITERAFVESVRDAGGTAAADAAQRYTATDAVPSTWDFRQHDAAFGVVPPRIEYSLASGPDARRVSGPYRNRSLDPGPVTLVPGETLTFDAVVTNSGGTAGDYEATFRLDGEPVATRTGRLDRGETTVTFSHAFDEPGTHVVAVGDATFEVSVVEPAAASVASVSVDPDTVTVGESVTVAATVRNDHPVPGETTVAVRAGDRTLATRLVRLDAGATRTVTTTASFDAPGTYRVTAGDAAPATVVVERTSGTTTSGQSGGFGAASALAALALAVVVGRLRR